MIKKEMSTSTNDVIVENQANDLIQKVGFTYPKTFTVYLPENLDLDRLINEHPPTSIPLSKKEDIKDVLAYILHLITYLPSVKKDYDYEANGGFVSINSTILQKSGIHNYKSFFDYLIDYNIILRDNQYIVGEFSRGIRFTDTYSFSKVKKYQIKKRTLIKAIFKKSHETNVLEQEKYSYLAKWWISDKLHLDYIGAKSYLEKKFKKSKRAFLKKHKMVESEYLQKQLKKTEKERKKTKAKYPTKQYNSALMLIDRLHRQEYIMKVDTTAGRFHTIFTQLPKDLKQFITCNGKQLVGIDLTNSQPLLATALLDKEIFDNNPLLMETIKRYNPYHRQEDITMLADLIEANQNKTDVLEYKKIVAAGKYYERFGADLQQNGLIPEEVRDIRGFAKDATFSAFFAPNSNIKYNEAMKCFCKIFPNVYSIFFKIKNTKKGTKKKYKAHSALSVALQALEAEIFLDEICKRISETNPDIPIFTIHDSVVTIGEYQEIVEQIVSEEIYKAIKVNPQIKIESWQ